MTRPMLEIPYSYWTGQQWVPTSIKLNPPMTAGWHIIHVLLSLFSFGLWLPIYGIAYWTSYADAAKKTEQALKSIETYNASLQQTGGL